MIALRIFPRKTVALLLDRVLRFPRGESVIGVVIGNVTFSLTVNPRCAQEIKLLRDATVRGHSNNLVVFPERDAALAVIDEAINTSRCFDRIRRVFSLYHGRLTTGSPSNAFIRDTCTTDRSDHHARRHAAGSTEDPDHAYHLLLDEVEAHGDQAHPGEDVERAGAQAEFLQGGRGRVTAHRHQVAEANCAEAGEAEVATLQQTPALETVEHDRAAAYIHQHYHEAQANRYPDWVGLQHVRRRRGRRQGQRAWMKVPLAVARCYILTIDSSD